MDLSKMIKDHIQKIRDSIQGDVKSITQIGSIAQSDSSMGSNSITVNGQRIEAPVGASISVINDIVYINGVASTEALKGIVEIRIEGRVGAVTVERGSVTCQNVEGDLTASGSVKCGNVSGNVKASGSIKCGSVGGSIKASGSVCHG